MPLQSPCIDCASTEDRMKCSKGCVKRDQYADAMEAKKPLSDLVVEKRIEDEKLRGCEDGKSSPSQPPNFPSSKGLVVEQLTQSPPGACEPVICKTEGCEHPATTRKDFGTVINGLCSFCMSEIMRKAKRKKIPTRIKNTVYTIKEVAAEFGVTGTAVSIWLRRANPMPMTLDGGYDLDEIKEWAKSEGLPRRRKKRKPAVSACGATLPPARDPDAAGTSTAPAPVVESPVIKNNLMDLNDHLFVQVERLLNKNSTTGDDLSREIDRSKALGDLASHVISNAKLALEAHKAINDGLINTAPKMLGMEKSEEKN